MPVVNIPPPSDPTPQPSTPPVKTQSDVYQGVTVDTRYHDFDSLTTFIAGQAWAVDYYSQLIGANDGLKGLQVGLSAVYQPYRLIRGFELKVSNPLSPSQDDETKEITLTGSSVVYSVLIPNVGDMFIADVGNGREGLFQVTASRVMSQFTEAVHEIDYALVQKNTAITRKDLKDKVVETVYFDKEYMRKGYTPLLHDSDLEMRNRLTLHYARLLGLYFNDFYSREMQTLLVPNQLAKTYDPFVVRFIKTIVGTEEHPLVRHTLELNVESDQAVYELTLWNCLETLDLSLLSMAVQQMGLVGVGAFFTRPMFNSIYYSQARQVIYPDQHQTNVDAGYRGTPTRELDHLVDGKTRFEELNRVIQISQLQSDPRYSDYQPSGPDAIPGIHRVTADNYYVFTQAFYEHEFTQLPFSHLEIQTLNALKGKPLDLPTLDRLCENAKFWDNLERFYYIPVLLTLLRIYPRSIA